MKNIDSNQISFFEFIKPHQETVRGCGRIITDFQYETLKNAVEDTLLDPNYSDLAEWVDKEDFDMLTDYWHGEGLPVLPAYEEYSVWDRSLPVGCNALFMTPKQYELFKKWIAEGNDLVIDDANSNIYGGTYIDNIDIFAIVYDANNIRVVEIGNI